MDARCVAFSRVRRSSDIKVSVIENEKQGKLMKYDDTVYTVNAVYLEILCQFIQKGCVLNYVLKESRKNLLQKLERKD